MMIIQVIYLKPITYYTVYKPMEQEQMSISWRFINTYPHRFILRMGISMRWYGIRLTIVKPLSLEVQMIPSPRQLKRIALFQFN